MESQVRRQGSRITDQRSDGRRKRFRLRKWSPFSAYSWFDISKHWVFEGERKVKKKRKFPLHTHWKEQQDASSTIPTSWKCHKHMNTLESIIPLVTRFWGKLAFCGQVARSVRQRHAATPLRMNLLPCKNSGVANHSTLVQKLDPSYDHKVLSVEICM